MLAGLLLSVNENTDGREFFYVMLWNVSLKVSTFNQFRRGEKNRSSIVEEYYYFLNIFQTEILIRSVNLHAVVFDNPILEKWRINM